MNIVLFGYPNAGKGTLSQNLKQYGFESISSGELLKKFIKDNGNNSYKLSHAIASGNLADDELVIGLVLSEMTKFKNKNVILDGVPRTIEQAKVLDKSINVDFAFELVVPIDEIMSRAKNRVVCSKCSRTTSLVVESKCKVCGSDFIKRAEDNIDALKVRIETYENLISEIKDFYDKKGILHVIDASKSAEDTLAQVKKVLGL